MSYTKIETVLKTVLPDAVYKVQAPETAEDGTPLLRYLVWTPTGQRFFNAEGSPFATTYQAVVTVAHIPMQPLEHSYDPDTATYYTDIPWEVI